MMNEDEKTESPQGTEASPDPSKVDPVEPWPDPPQWEIDSPESPEEDRAR